MITRCSLLFLLLSGALFGAPSRESLAVQEMRISLDQVNYQLHGHQAEIDLFQDRLRTLESSVEKLNQQLKQGQHSRSLEGRLSRLEKAHETLISDFKTLKTHLNETTTSLATCQNKLTRIDKQLSSDVKSLKQSLESMLTFLQKGDASIEGAYVVKPGDSLGQIALDHKTDIKTLKRLNNLSSDTIYVGQRLALP